MRHGRAASAVGRTRASLVPRAMGRAERPLPRASRASDPRGARSGRTPPEPRRRRRPSRRAPDGDPRRRRGSARRRGGRRDARVARDRPRGAGRRARRSAPPRLSRGGHRPLRARRRADDPRDPLRDRRGRSRPPPQAAPYRHRWRVGGAARSRAHGALPRLRRTRSARGPYALDHVLGFRGVAAVPARGAPRSRALVVLGRAPRRPVAPHPPFAAPRSARPHGGGWRAPIHDRPPCRRRAQGARSPPRQHAVRGAPRVVLCAPPPVLWPERLRRRHRGRRARTARGGAAPRLLRQHARPALRPRRRPLLLRAPAAHEPYRARGVRAPGAPVRLGGQRARGPADLRAQPARAGGARPRARADEDVRGRRHALDGVGRGGGRIDRRGCQVRSHAPLRRERRRGRGRRARGDARIQRRSVRRGLDRADGASLRRAPRRARRGARTPPQRGGAARRTRESAAPRGVERHRRAVPRDLRPSPLRAAGGAGAVRARRGLRRRTSLLRRARRPRQSHRPRAPGFGRSARGPDRDRAPPLRRSHRGGPRGLEGRRRVSPARPRLPRRTSRVHALRFGRAARGDVGRARAVLRRNEHAAPRVRSRERAHRRPARDPADAHRRAREPRLRHLHVRLHRDAQRDAPRAPRTLEPRRGRTPDARHGPRDARPAVCVLHVRCLRPGDPFDPHLGRDPVRRASRSAPSGARPRGVHRAPPDLERDPHRLVALRHGARAGPRVDHPDDRRRSLSGGARSQVGPRPCLLQRLRPDRVDRRRHDVPVVQRAASLDARTTDREHTALRPRRTAEARAHRRDR